MWDYFNTGVPSTGYAALFEFTEAFLEAPEGKKSKYFSTEQFILGGLQSLAKEIAIEFSFKTKMDDFQIASVSFAGSLGYEIPSQDMTQENKKSMAQHLAEFRQKMVESNGPNKGTP